MSQHLLRLLLSVRTLDKHPAQAPSAQHFYPHHHGPVGYMYGLHGADAQFPRNDDCQVVLGYGRSRPIPRNQLLPIMLVQEKRIRYQSSYLLLGGRCLWVIRWSSRSRNRSNDWYWRQERLGLDLHPRRPRNSPRRHRLILDGL